jgi:hypothetical protein
VKYKGSRVVGKSKTLGKIKVDPINEFHKLKSKQLSTT